MEISIDSIESISLVTANEYNVAPIQEKNFMKNSPNLEKVNVKN